MQKIADIIKQNNNFLLCCHMRPDGDAIGSSLALYLALKKLNKNVDIMCDDEISSSFSYLAHIENFNKKTLDNYDMAISLDCSDLSLMGVYSKYFDKNKNCICIDHHRTNNNYAKYNLVKSDFASTCEVVFDVIKAMNVEFDDDIATSLYTGISTDTGNFVHSNTTSDTLLKASILAKYNVNINKLNFILYKSMSKEKLIVLGKTLNNAKFYFDDKVCILTIRKDYFEGLNFSESISSGIVDYAINLESSLIGISILEAKPNTFKISFRCREPLDVAALAGLFGGGGHKLASGCVICGFYEDVVDKILKGISDLFLCDMNGFLNILKPTGLTSSDVVTKVKRILNQSKVGHMGTLDPAGSGVLPIAIGKSARLFPYLTYKIKKYRAYFTFSKTTDTLDSFGTIISENNIIPTKEAILSHLNAFVGEIKQIPPKYSAINIGGRKAYDMARNGEEFEIKERETTVYSFELIEQISADTFAFDIVCSGGTYVRSLCRDLSEALGTVGYMSLIIRLASGNFTIENSITLKELEENKDRINDFLVSPFDVVGDIEMITVEEKYYDKLSNGVSIALNEKDGLYRVVCKNEFFGIYEIKENQLKIVTYLRDA